MTFQTGKNSQQYLPGKVRDNNTATKATFIVRDWAAHVQHNSTLLTGFCLIAYSSYLANRKNQRASDGWKQVLHYFRGNGNFYP